MKSSADIYLSMHLVLNHMPESHDLLYLVSAQSASIIVIRTGISTNDAGLRLPACKRWKMNLSSRGKSASKGQNIASADSIHRSSWLPFCSREIASMLKYSRSQIPVQIWRPPSRRITCDWRRPAHWVDVGLFHIWSIKSNGRRLESPTILVDLIKKPT